MEDRGVEHELVYPLEKGNAIMNDKDLAGFIETCAKEEFAGKGQRLTHFQLTHAAIELDGAGASFVRAKAKMRLYGKTEIPIAEVEEMVPILVTELNTLARALLKGSIFEPLTAVVVEMISTVVPKHAIAFYCGADSGSRPGKSIVLSIFKAIEEFFGELDIASKGKAAKDDVLQFMIKTRQRPVDATEVVARLLAAGNVPLSAATGIVLIDTWFCDPVTMARAFDRLLQFPKRAVEPTVWEPTSGEGAAKVGTVEVETSKSGFGSAIESAIHSVLRAAGVNKVVRAMDQVIFSLGVQRLIGRKLDESLDPTIDIHIMNAVLLQKLFSGPQSPGMPNDASCVQFFYVDVLGKMIEENAPKLVHAAAKKAVATVASVTMRADMLEDLVYNFVLPHLCIALEELGSNHTIASK
jgi:hypothetical protein